MLLFRLAPSLPDKHSLPHARFGLLRAETVRSRAFVHDGAVLAAGLPRAFPAIHARRVRVPCRRPTRGMAFSRTLLMTQLMVRLAFQASC